MTRIDLSKTLLALGILAALWFVFAVARHVNAQNQLSTDIADRLKQQGVPVKQVTTLNRLPYEIEIALQSSSSDSDLSMDDNWFMQLADREATFAYRLGTRLKSFKLTIYNAHNELIYSTQTYLYPQDLNQQLERKSPKVDALQAREIVASQLTLGGLALDKLVVSSDSAISHGGQIVVIHVSAENLETVNGSLPNFLGSLFRVLDTGNTEQGMDIILCHLIVSDGNGNVLLDYVKDLEAGSAQWKSAPGLYHDWFPAPRGPGSVTPVTPFVPPAAYPAALDANDTTEGRPSPNAVPALYP